MKYTKTQLNKMRKDEVIDLLLEMQEKTIDSHAQKLSEKRRQKKEERLQGYYKLLEEHREEIKSFSKEDVSKLLGISLKTFYNLKIGEYLEKHKFKRDYGWWKI